METNFLVLINLNKETLVGNKVLPKAGEVVNRKTSLSSKLCGLTESEVLRSPPECTTEEPKL